MIDGSCVDLLSAADDGFHAPGDDPWFFESSWWSFYVPERDLGAWIYHWVRPNQSTQGGGCWIYDATTPFHLEVPYYACYENLPFERATMESFDRQHAINVRAPYALTLAALPHLSEGASIVFISSVFGQIGLAGATGYCASKGAIEQLTRTLALELAPRGIRVNSVAPGFILTALNQANFGSDTPIKRAVEADTPAGRIGDVHDVAPAVAYLAGDEASFVQGATLVVDGGWAAR